jgi:hypothetical protein
LSHASEAGAAGTSKNPHSRLRLARRSLASTYGRSRTTKRTPHSGQVLVSIGRPSSE